MNTVNINRLNVTREILIVESKAFGNEYFNEDSKNTSFPPSNGQIGNILKKKIIPLNLTNVVNVEGEMRSPSNNK